VVNLVGRPLLRAMDLCGVKSGREIDKFAHCGLTPMPMAGLDRAPAIAEAPICLGCKVRQTLPLGSHDLLLAEIVAVQADRQLLDARGALHLSRADLVAFGHGEYTALGEALGFLGYSVASPEALARRMAALQER
jgi:flavin reductase (DIM6/NTAB) family NADH-FMN oxidoreductase RutF